MKTFNTLAKVLIWTGYLFGLACLIAWLFVGGLHLPLFAIIAATVSKALETDKITKEMLK